MSSGLLEHSSLLGTYVQPVQVRLLDAVTRTDRLFYKGLYHTRPHEVMYLSSIALILNDGSIFLLEQDQPIMAI